MVRRYLFILYNRMLERARSLPSDEMYRGRPENLARRGRRICREEVDLSMIEKRISCGGVQDLIHQAHAELHQLDLLLKEASEQRLPPMRLFGTGAFDVSKAI
ncbi:ETC complex I subunit [Parasponia andersonii]|uniref:ETC complex I subunit n=1 Tax=Parasponia andersonii TaxID=3476 RepID=A0A2P5BX00_PARAD|nr:ETC complex I subunit [Parasponia andersonii]